MSERGGAALGLAIMVVLAIWWLPGVAEALRNGDDVAPLAASLLAGLLIVRVLAVAAVGWRAGCGLPAGAALATLALLVSMAWPLVLLAAWSSEVALMSVLAAEVLLLVLAGLIVAGARVLRRLPVTRDSLHAVAVTAGVTCAALLWTQRHAYLGWVTP